MNYQNQTIAPVKSDDAQLWKLFRQKYVLTFKLCRDCSQTLFNSTKSNECNNNNNSNNRAFEEDGYGGVRVQFRLCKGCTLLNLTLSDFYAVPKNNNNNINNNNNNYSNNSGFYKNYKNQNQGFNNNYNTNNSCSTSNNNNSNDNYKTGDENVNSNFNNGWMNN
uniref:Uncharacterized protein n=1 Tax=Globodera rostochiensis TaxID=31243 RepID=A0A914I487_GLORO